MICGLVISVQILHEFTIYYKLYIRMALLDCSRYRYIQIQRNILIKNKLLLSTSLQITNRKEAYTNQVVNHVFSVCDRTLGQTS